MSAITFAEALAKVRAGDEIDKAWSPAARAAAQRKRKRKKRPFEDDWSDRGPDKRDDGAIGKRIRGWGADEISQIQKRPARHPFELAVDRVRRERPHLRRYEALAAARRENPESFKHWQQQGRVQPPATAKSAPPEAIRKWNMAVDSTATARRCSKTEAAHHVATRYPRLYEEFQNA